MATAYSATAEPRIRVWDLPLRLFHWLLVAAIAVAIYAAFVLSGVLGRVQV